MLPKPAACQGCRLYGDGTGFVPDCLVPDAAVLILAQNPGTDEEQGERVVGVVYSGRGRVPVKEPNLGGPAPLIGMTGYDMEREFFPLAGLTREGTSLANVLKCRQVVAGRRTNDLPKGRILRDAAAHCTAAYLHIPATTRLVVAMGALAASWTGCPGSVSAWRGFAYPLRVQC